ncbi:ThiF family adenylyltransferase [Spirosoma sp. 48-14]|uniref:E2/UBC family protein n=1 Tax=Spirosoma sp. 48-14 TaxID=1895854 RepID=UPI0009683C5F|nr:ThiF family adenylyltransferase [Spirosoma sp. 48-14]OJW77879.1 MAG: hypothetical protein BGO59_23985 [Spirosoma sp. 48-14]
MVDFETACRVAFQSLSQTNTVEKVIVATKAKKGVKLNKELWKVAVEIPVTNGVRDFNLFLDVKRDFPLSLPKIYLSEEDYDAIKYIPHVDTSRNICLFDQENIKIDTDRPAEIVRVCLQRAIKIITDGINQNNASDFKDEIIAYWENKYHTEDKVFSAYIGDTLEIKTPGKFQTQFLTPAYSGVNIIVGSESNIYKRLLDFFKARGHKIENRDAFYLGCTDNLKPPFHFTNSKLLQFIKSEFSHIWSEVTVYLNSSFDSKIFIFSISLKEETIFFGFYIHPFTGSYKGWRQQSLNTIKIMSQLKPTIPVTRLTFEYFSPERITKRTDGIVLTKDSYKFVIAGLGSIGSNLIFYLSGLNISDVILVDPDILSIENVNRHLLSFNEVGDYKVNGIANFLTTNFPFIQVEKHAKSIISILEEDISSINEMDFLFLAIGKDAIEKYILQCLSEGKITIPIILFWIEPYLLGAHILYINPKTGFDLRDLEINGVYKYNIISDNTYRNPEQQLMLREAGCQGSYTPYGREAIMKFFASFLPILFTLIREKPENNIAWTYTGDYNLANSMNIEISDFGKDFDSNQLINHSI